ncbi:S1 family peptidase [Zavarzinia sp. CC-PAN008]|uniref:S1 family peptidase n=1 Tax=Zavarzinia sp. CC-PAN008 TaxID=3243332 RepID=UPI003F7428BD
MPARLRLPSTARAALLGLGALLWAGSPAQAIDGVALVMTPVGSNSVRACTGVLFSPRAPMQPVFVLGAEHCLGSGPQPTEVIVGASLSSGQVKLGPGGGSVPVAGARVVRGAGLDLFFAPVDARRLGPRGSLPLASFAERMPRPGNRVDVLGFPGGEGPVKQRCVYEGAWLQAEDGLSRFRIAHELSCAEREVWQGLSGGPVLDRDERVIGIVQSTNAQGTALYFAAVLQDNIGVTDRQPLVLGEAMPDAEYERVRLGRSARVFEISARFRGGLLDGAAIITRDGAPHVEASFSAGRLEGALTVYTRDGDVWISAAIHDGRFDLKDFLEAERYPEVAAMRTRVAHILDWALQGEPLDE